VLNVGANEALPGATEANLENLSVEEGDVDAMKRHHDLIIPVDPAHTPNRHLDNR
jgi:hypothetical protein